MGGCAAGAGGAGDGDFDVEANAIGVTRIVVEHSTENGDSVLVVQGVDAGGTELASLRLRTGTVLYSAEDNIPETPSLGTELVFDVRGAGSRIVAPDLLPHKLYSVGSVEAEAFFQLAAVRQQLDQEAGITTAFRDHNEIAFDTQTALASMHPSGVFANQACFDGTVSMATSSTNDDVVRTRAYNAAGGGAGCKASDGVSSCSGTSCYFGKLGFAATVASTSAGQRAVIWTDGNGMCSQNWFNRLSFYEFDAVTGTGAQGCPK